MKVTVDPRTLRDAVRIARRIILRQSTLPALTCVLLTVADGRLTVRSTNLEAYCCRVVTAITSEPGAIAVQAKTLYDVLGALRGAITIETAGRSIRIAGDGADLTLPAIDAADFPVWDDLGERSGSLTVNASAFRRLIDTAIRSAAPDDSRPVLSGVQLRAGADGLTVASGDGFRLTTQRVEAWPGDLSALVPWHTLQEIARSAKPDDVFDVGTHDRLIGGKEGCTDRTFRVATPDGSWWESRMVEGAFPDYKRIIPKPDTIKTRATLSADDLRRVANLARVMSGSEILRLTVNTDGLVARIRDAENGQGSFRIAATVSGEPVQVAIRATFLRDALAGIAGRVTLAIVSPSAPVTIYATGDDCTRHYVMPMRVER